MGDWLSSLPWRDIGPTGIVTLIVLMILTDRLVTRRRLEEAEKRADKWEAAYVRTRDQLDKVLEGERPTIAAAKAALHVVPDQESRHEGGVVDEQAKA